MITGTWIPTPLGNVISHRNSFVTIDDRESYKRCRVQLNARGIVLRDKVLGVEIKTKDQQVCRNGDFLVAEIDAKLGGFGIVPEPLDGAIVSSHYFLFAIDESRLRRTFLDYCIRTPQFQDQVRARGSTNYAAIRPHHVLEYAIPLPDPEEQDRIIAKLDAIAARLRRSQQHWHDIAQDSSALLRSAFHRIAESAQRKPMSEVAPLTRRPVTVDIRSEYPQLSVRSFGRGIFHREALRGADVSWEKPFLIRSGDIILSNIKAWEGAVAVAGPNDDGRVGSHRYLTCVPIPDVATAGFICFYLLTNEGLAALGRASPGSADRNRTLGVHKLAQIEVPVPPIKLQLWFDRLQAKVHELRSVLSESKTGLDALLPAALDRAFKGQF
jgi:type I restriction enzyme S subunit